VIQFEFLLFSLTIAVGIFVGALVLLAWGRRLGARYLAREGSATLGGLGAIEGAVFALMGLLLAFALSGALQRFDERRQLILQEANAISTAYDRVDLMDDEARSALKAQLKSYVKARLDLYRMPIAFSPWRTHPAYSSGQLELIAKRNADLWRAAVAACRPAGQQTACSSLLAALNNVSEVARLRSGSNERHPPQIMYVMLFSVGLGGSLLAGFGMAVTKRQSWVHMLVFAAALSSTLFVITSIEFPRLGLFRVDYFDHFLVEVYEAM
jgi:hypothetical protein